MRDARITTINYSNVLITTGRYGPLQTKIVCKLNNNTILPLSVIKQAETAMLGTTPTVPNIAPSVQVYWTLNT